MYHWSRGWGGGGESFKLGLQNCITGQGEEKNPLNLDYKIVSLVKGGKNPLNLDYKIVSLVKGGKNPLNLDYKIVSLVKGCSNYFSFQIT